MSQSQDPIWSNMANSKPQLLQTASELYMDNIVLRAKWKYPDKNYELRYFNCVFLAHFFR